MAQGMQLTIPCASLPKILPRDIARNKCQNYQLIGHILFSRTSHCNLGKLRQEYRCVPTGKRGHPENGGLHPRDVVTASAPFNACLNLINCLESMTLVGVLTYNQISTLASIEPWRLPKSTEVNKEGLRATMSHWLHWMLMETISDANRANMF